MVDRGQPWLVVIDLQRIFGDPASEWATSGFDAILPRVRELLAEHRGRVVVTRFVPPEQPAGSWVDYYERWPFALEADPSFYDLVSGLGLEDLPRVDRPTMGKWGADLLAATGGSRDLVLCGVSTDCCVLSTALAAADDGCWVRVETTACAGASPEDHGRALDAMELYAPQITVVRP